MVILNLEICFISEKLLLPSREAKEYNYLVKGCYHVDGIDDHEEFQYTEVDRT